MAVSGGVTAAYRCQVVDGTLEVINTSALRSVCVPVEDAFSRLGRGEQVLVQGSDMAELRRVLGVRDAVGVAVV